MSDKSDRKRWLVKCMGRYRNGNAVNVVAMQSEQENRGGGISRAGMIQVRAQLDKTLHAARLANNHVHDKRRKPSEPRARAIWR